MSNNPLLERLEGLRPRFEEVSTLITDPAVIGDRQRYVKLTREYRELQRLMDATDRYRSLLGTVEEAKELLQSEEDEEMREMARQEMADAEKQIPDAEQEVKLLLIPSDPDDAKNAIVEIRGGTGGDEAALFAGDLFRMYQKFAEQRHWQLAVSSYSEGAAGGFKEIVFSLTGEGVYGVMKYESGVHRVQRVPGNRGRAPRGRGVRRGDQRGRNQMGHFSLRWCRRPECEQGGVWRSPALQLAEP